MKKLNKIFLLVLIVGIVAGCKSNKSRESLKPEVNGLAGEVIVVTSQGKWESMVGDTLRSILKTPEIGLPVAEPKFNPIFIPNDGFGSLYRTQRNILLAKIGPEFSERKITMQKGTYAKSQLIIVAQAPSDTAFVKIMHENREKIINLIQDTERLRLMDTYKKHKDVEIAEMLRNEHNIDMVVPKGYEVSINKPGFVWLANSHRNIIENIVICYYDYTDDSTFTKNYQIKKRNNYIKQIPGEVEGSYVTTELRAPVYFDTFNMNYKYTVQLRGLWRVQDGLAMGGPFLSITQYDKPRNRVVTIEGFVFAPNEDKRDYIRRAEAVMYSADYPTGE